MKKSLKSKLKTEKRIIKIYLPFLSKEKRERLLKGRYINVKYIGKVRMMSAMERNLHPDQNFNGYKQSDYKRCFVK